MVRRFSRHRALPFVAFGLLVVGIFGGALIPPSGMLLYGDDIHRYFFFLYEFAHNAIAHGEIPWWNPYILSGLPFLESPKVALFYPPNWLLVFAPTPTAFSWYVAFHIWLAMAAMFWLLRKISNFKFQISNLASWISGVVYGLSGFFMVRVWAGHVDMIATAAVAPIAFGLFWQAVTLKGRGEGMRVARAAVGVALLYISGYQIIAFFFYEAMAIAAGIVSVFRKSIRPVLIGFASGLLGLGVAAVQFIPNTAFLFRSVRTFPFPYAWSVIGALTPDYLAEFIRPFQFGDQWTYFGPWQFYHERAAFMGQVALVMALAAILWVVIRRLKRPDVWALTAIALFGLWMAMANNAPIDLLALLRHVIPTYRTIRIPSRHLVLFVFSFAALSGLGVGLVRKKRYQVVIGLLVLIELVPFARHFISLAPQPATSYDRELLSRYTAEGPFFRVLPNFNAGHNLRNNLDFDSGMQYGFYSATGYETGMLRNYYEFIDAANMQQEPSFTVRDIQVPDLTSRAFTQGYADFLNIRYIMVPQSSDPIGTTTPEHFVVIRNDDSRGYRLYENRRVLPRFFFVPNAVSLSSREQVAQAIRKGANLSDVVLLSSSTPVDIPTVKCDRAMKFSVNVLSYGINRIVLSVESACDAYLISSEVMYPGWGATIDGEHARIFEGNLAFRTLFVPRGAHEIIFAYHPVTLPIGIAVTVLSVGIIVVLRRKY